VMLVSLVAIFALAGFPPGIGAEPAATIAVTTTSDEYGTGSDCSLREAIQAANDNVDFGGCRAGGTNPVIELPKGTYALTRTGPDDDTNSTGDLDLDADITINGAGQEITIIDGRDLRDRVMHVLGQVVALNGLTIGGGQAPNGRRGADGASPGEAGGAGEDGQHGGGIYNQGTLALFDCVVVSNRAGDGGAGGQGQAGADGVADGEPGQYGGGGGSGGSGGNGGGIYNATGATLSLDRCTISRNEAGSGGQMGRGGQGGDGAPNGYGGDGGSGGSVGVGGYGGGIYSADGATTTISRSTIDRNQSGEGGLGGDGGPGGLGGTGEMGGYGGEGSTGGWGGGGGGIFSSGPMTITRSIILDNSTGRGGDGGDGGDAAPAGAGDSEGGEGGPGGEGGKSGEGGGIFHALTDSPLLVTACTIEGNRTGGGGAGGDGGQGATGGTGTSGSRGGNGGYGAPGGTGGGSGDGGGVSVKNGTFADTMILRNRTGPGGNGGAGGSGGAGGTGDSGAAGGDGGEGGSGGDGGSPYYGGGLRVTGEVLLDGCTITQNTAGDGGDAGTAAVGGMGGTGGSSPAGDGGAGGEGGSGGSGGHGAAGGGLYTSGSAVLTILTSTIDGNVAGDGGRSTPGATGGAGGAPGSGSGAASAGANGDGGYGGSGATGGNGGGLDLGTVTEIEDSTINANRAGNAGAGADGGNAGSNPASATGLGGRGRNGGHGGYGGGIYNLNKALTMTNVTISGNIAGAGGDGGNSGTGPEGQQAGGDGGDAGKGGGIYNQVQTTANVHLVYSTIARNLAEGSGGLGGTGVPAGEDGMAGQGGGAYNAGEFIFDQTILGDNEAAGAGPDCYGTLIAGDYSLVEKVSDCTLTGSTNIYTGLEPLLAPLANNTGPTETHLPLPDSPALDGNGNACHDASGGALLTDQRGRSRPVDGDDSGGAQCDIGAVEVQGYRLLSVNLSGDGTGSVASTPAGIECGDGGSDCQEPYDLDTVVTLRATAASASRFLSWSGGCSGTTATCSVTMDAAKTVTAAFDTEFVYLPLVLRNWP
jgi:CSLREA domain-containing protein